MGEEPQRAEPVVEADPDDARFLDDLGHVGLVRAAVDEPSPVDEHVDRQPGVGGDVLGRPEFDLVKPIIVSTAEAVAKQTGVTVPYIVGTMIELPRAALRAGEIAESAEFFSFGHQRSSSASSPA